VCTAVRPSLQLAVIKTIRIGNGSLPSLNYSEMFPDHFRILVILSLEQFCACPTNLEGWEQLRERNSGYFPLKLSKIKTKITMHDNMVLKAQTLTTCITVIWGKTCLENGIPRLCLQAV
jgi:hypothetical protein